MSPRLRESLFVALLLALPASGLSAPGGAQTQCLLASAKAGGASAKTVACLSARAAGKARACPKLDIRRVASADTATVADDAPESSAALDERYLEAFQRKLIPRGDAIAACFAALARSGIERTARLAGSIAVEVSIGPNGRPQSVLLLESGVDGRVVGCVVEALCALAAPPPPGREPFVLELPFSFKDPR